MVDVPLSKDMTVDPKNIDEAVENARDEISQDDFESLMSEMKSLTVEELITKLNSVKEETMISEGGDILEDLLFQLVEYTLIQKEIYNQFEEEEEE